MKIHSAAPNTLEWLQARVGIPTASELDQLLTPHFKIRTGQMPVSYCHRKLAEAWLGSTISSFQSIDMEIGQILERDAIPAYELMHNVTIQRVGLVLTDDESFGASPDGLIGTDAGIEIKAPRADTHVKYLLGREVPEEHRLQVHGGMFATGAKRWVFMSYSPRLPYLVVEVQRDPEAIDAISEALEKFHANFSEGWKRLCDLNGGPPKRTPFVQYVPKPKPAFTPTTEDVPT